MKLELDFPRNNVSFRLLLYELDAHILGRPYRKLANNSR